MARLTRKEREAVCTVLQEFLAGADLERARSLTDSEQDAKEFLGRIAAAIPKLMP